MSDSKYLLDTSALLAFLEDEPGAAQVETLLRQEQLLLPFLVLLECHYITLQEQTEDVADRRYATLKQLPVSILWEVDEATLLTASQIKAHHRLSLADALIAAFAVRNGAILVHKDPEYEALDKIVNQKKLPFKS